MTKVDAGIKVKAGMSLEYVMTNGSRQQNKVACVFDQDTNGYFDETEARLFNATTIDESEKGVITFRTNMSTGRKIENKIKEEDLMTVVLDIYDKYVSRREKRDGKIYEIRTRKEEVRTRARDHKPAQVYGDLVDENPITKSKRYEYSCEYLDPKTGKFIEDKEYTITNIYGEVVETKEINIIGEHQEYDGYTITKGKTKTYYGVDNKKVGSKEDCDDGKIKVTDKNGKVLYYYEEENSYYDGYTNYAFYTPDGQLYYTATAESRNGDYILKQYENDKCKKTSSGAIDFDGANSDSEWFVKLDDLIDTTFIIDDEE